MPNFLIMIIFFAFPASQFCRANEKQKKQNQSNKQNQRKK